jgi:uncharacterized protein (TIGR03437 family)
VSELVTSRTETSAARGLAPFRISVRVPLWIIALALSCAALHLFSSQIRISSSDPAWKGFFIEYGWELFKEDNRFFWETILLVVGILAGWVFPGARRSRFARGFLQLAANHREAVVFSALVPVALRLALFPTVGIPPPRIADEFGYLLLADTFASGRIVNPPHPMWEHFETLYVLQQPVQASIYPFATGILMAIPKALGLEPWFAVLVSVGFMSGAICWMLQGWVRAQWALLFALLAGLHIGIDTYWINSYWGGAFASGAGALVLGALPRLNRTGNMGPALLMTAGLAILVQSRPFEGSLLFAVIAGAIVLHYFRSGPSWRKRFLRSGAPTLVLGGIAILAASLSYNWRVTGNPLLPPYLLHQKVYGTPQNFRFGQEITSAPRAAVHTDIEDNFEWQRQAFHSQITWSGLTERLGIKLRYLWSFFLGPALSVPLILFGIWDRRVRLLSAALLVVVFGAGILYPFFFPHYIGPAYAAMLGVAARGLSRIRAFRFSRGPVGHNWVRSVVAASVFSSLMGTLGWTSLVSATSLESTPRLYIEEQLKQRGGSHLVLVRYSDGHDFHRSWIYNEARTDQSAIVWGRDLGKAGNKPLLRCYPEREVWLAEPDENPPLLTPYFDQDRPRITAVLNAAGKSNYFKEGIAPGSIVTIVGRNLARGVSANAAAEGFSPAQNVLLASPKLIRDQKFSKALRLPGIRVEFDGRDAPILGVSRDGDQETLSVLVPAELSRRTVDLSIEAGGQERLVKLPVLAANPGIFQMRSPSGQVGGAVMHEDGTPVTSRRPARRGEIVYMLVTGLGREPVRGVVVGVNHRGAGYRWTRRSQPFPGLDVIAFQVPDTAPSGPQVPLSMAVDAAGVRVYSNNSTIAVE